MKVVTRINGTINTYTISGNEVAKTEAVDNGAYGLKTNTSFISIAEYSKELLRLEDEGAYIEYL